MSNEKIKAKIQKLLALSESSNEHEAKAALVKAQELLAKHHLEMGEIHEESEPIGMRYTKVVANKDWKRKLAIIIAKNFRCEVVVSKMYDEENIHHQRKTFISFFGYETDANIAAEIFEMAEAMSTKNADRLYRKLRSKGELVPGIRAGYYEGFNLGLAETYEKQRTSVEYALVLTTPPEVKEEMKHMSTRKFSSKRYQNKSAEAGLVGRQDGQDFGSSKKIEA